MDIQLKETNKFDLPKSKTDRVLEKWENEGEIQKESIRKAASQYAKLEINNKILKWIIAVVVVFLFVLLGMMIASVVLGVHITKEVTVKNGALVSSSGNNSIVKTTNLKYHNEITLNSPASVIDSLDSITIDIIDGLNKGVLHFEVVSYIFVPGKQLVFYGHTHQASVLPDGSVKLESLVPFNGKRDGSSSDSGASISGTSTSTGTADVVEIRTCADFALVSSSGKYVVVNDLSCTQNNFALPLAQGQTFNGILDGNGKTLTLNHQNNGEIALFSTVGEFGSVTRLNVAGSLSGSVSCATFANNALPGAFFSKDSSRVQITCNGNGVVAGGFVASVPTGSNVVITKSVSQVKFVSTDATGVFGGFYGKSASTTSNVDISFCASGNTFVIPTGATKDDFGTYGSSLTGECRIENNYCLVPVGQTSNPHNCCKPVENCPNNPSKQNCDSLFCYSCRDTSSRNSSKRRALSLDSKDAASSETVVTPLFPVDVCV